MIPPVTDPIWAEVITEKRKVPRSQVGLNMLVANLRASYSRDPESLGQLVVHLHEFVAKYGTYYRAELDELLKSENHA